MTEHKVIGSTDLKIFEELLDNASKDDFKLVGGISVTHIVRDDDILTYYHQLMIHEWIGTKNNLFNGWRKSSKCIKGESYWYNDEFEMMIIGTLDKSTLVKENEIFLEFDDDNHLESALSKFKEIFELV